ncbi:MAG TPA: hypothetical protein VGI30_13855 [Caulobacteraceae bacterium]|jgi:hypothetical protein
MKSLRTAIVAVAAALATAGAASAGVTPTQATINPPPARLFVGVYSSAEPAVLENTAWVWGGRNYCWYPGGWRGPGYYWCGYAWRRGFGWGGPVGWNGWGGGGWHRGWRGHGWGHGWHGHHGHWRH